MISEPLQARVRPQPTAGPKAFTGTPGRRAALAAIAATALITVPMLIWPLMTGHPFLAFIAAIATFGSPVAVATSHRACGRSAVEAPISRDEVLNAYLRSAFIYGSATPVILVLAGMIFAIVASDANPGVILFALAMAAFYVLLLIPVGWVIALPLAAVAGTVAGWVAIPPSSVTAVPISGTG